MDDIVKRLRQWVDRETIESDPAGVITAAADEIERLRLTDAERCAIAEASEFYIGTRTGVTLSGLLKRLG